MGKSIGFYSQDIARIPPWNNDPKCRVNFITKAISYNDVFNHEFFGQLLINACLSSCTKLSYCEQVILFDTGSDQLNSWIQDKLSIAICPSWSVKWR